MISTEPPDIILKILRDSKLYNKFLAPGQVRGTQDKLNIIM